MTINEWLQQKQSELAAAKITTARLDCLVLLSDILEKDKSWILAHPEYVLQIEQLEILNTKIAQRTTHTPLAYIRGKTEFYGHEFTISNNVLEPRPESETIIELLKTLPIQTQNLTIADIGTGSGALAVTAKLEVPEAAVFATDINPSCLDVARNNAKQLGAKITFFAGNLLEPLFGLNKQFVLLCNLPYVPNDYPINRAATHEPSLALFGGVDGLDLYRTLFEQTKQLKALYILAESLPEQHEALAALAKAASYSLETTDDFIQLFKRS